MRHIILGLALSLFFIGCGSDNKTTEKDPISTNGEKPLSPLAKEKEKIPPSIPNI